MRQLIEPSHLDLCCLQKPIISLCGSERVKLHIQYQKTIPVGTQHWKKGKRKVQGVTQSQTAALPRHQEEEKTDKTKQAQIKQTYVKH